MPNTINPNSFFNQEEGGTDSAIQLAQSSFNLSQELKTQITNIIQNFDSFKVEVNEHKEFITNISNNFEEIKQDNTQRDEIIKQSFADIHNNFIQVTESIEIVSDDVDAVSKVFFDFQGSQVKAKEAELDQAWEQEDASQKSRKQASDAGGGGGPQNASAAIAENDGAVKDRTDEKRGFWGNLGRGLMSPITGIAHATAALGGTLTHGVMGGLDWLTGNRTDFDAEGGRKKDIPGTKLFKGIANMFGGGDKKDSSGILGPISSDVNDMVNMDGMKVTGEKKENKGLFGGLFGKKDKPDSSVESNLEQRVSNLETKTSAVVEKGKGGGFKRAAGGFADFATGGMFDFDKKNRKGAPKDFGIRRVAGGLTDWATMGATDFDKRGKGTLQFDPLFGGKDKAWGSADEQAKRGEKQSGMGIKRGIGGALDFATLGTFDFDKQNRKGAPKGWGIKRVAGGLADAITAGATDFDKRGTGIGQMNLGEKRSKWKAYEKYLNSDSKKEFDANEEHINTHPLDRGGIRIEGLNNGEGLSYREIKELANDGNPKAIKFLGGLQKLNEGQPEGGSYNWQKESTISDSKGSTTFKQSYGNNTGNENLQALIDPPEDTTEIMDAINKSGTNNTIQEGGDDQTVSDMGGNDAFTPATGTYCQIECINDAKSNSAFNLMY